MRLINLKLINNKSVMFNLNKRIFNRTNNQRIRRLDDKNMYFEN